MKEKGKKRNNNRELTVPEQMFYKYIVYGALFLICAATSFAAIIVPDEAVAVIFEAISTLAFFLTVVIMLRLGKAQKEQIDEMTEQELQEACFRSMNRMDELFMLVLVAASGTSLIGNLDFVVFKSISADTVLRSAEVAVYAYLGLKNLMIGISFRRQEKEGCME